LGAEKGKLQGFGGTPERNSPKAAGYEKGVSPQGKKVSMRTWAYQEAQLRPEVNPPQQEQRKLLVKKKKGGGVIQSAPRRGSVSHREWKNLKKFWSRKNQKRTKKKDCREGGAANGSLDLFPAEETPSLETSKQTS